jgi:hypothetical protein
MKKICLVAFIAAVLVSCNNNKNAIIASLEAENQQLKSQVSAEQSGEDNSEPGNEKSELASESGEYRELKKASDEEIEDYINHTASLNGFNKQKDDFKETTFYMHSSISELKNNSFNVRDTTNICLYFIK